MTARDGGAKTVRRPPIARKQTKADVSTRSDEDMLAGIPVVELTPAVHKAVRALMAEVKTLRVELAHAKGQITKLENLADHDPLLNIYNRRAFVRELNRMAAMVDRHRLQACLVFIDLNGLKKINDEKGHQAGDAALTHIGAVLTSHTRQSDILGRLGGDEFGLLLTHVTPDIADKKAAELAAFISNAPVKTKDGAFYVSVAYGVVTLAKGVTVEETIAAADEAMYASKRAT